MITLPRIENAGISAWLVRLFEQIDDANLTPIMALARQSEHAFGAALIDLTPSYTTLLVEFDLLQMTPAQALLKLQGLLAEFGQSEAIEEGPLKQLPVWYEASVGPDLLHLATRNNLSVEQLIEWHTATIYKVFALGFAPGFAFMGSVDARLDAPRLATPRSRVYAGSVAVAGRQTSAYPAQSPGGWNLLGRTPLTLFDRSREQMSYFQVGDRVQMLPITKQEFLRLGGDPTPQEDT
ncbi:5-oxoprolinase subunit PxpB [Pseudomonas sp. C27(2019)]|uniref:5-oxoprolinase subunit PxpB n=1 Tax=Pseudomonas sp. C27(2019) TaxID=2604941 RepID=UPI00124804A1|nr:5-oxoprolinase subunit PxpB [Pseudomonas sp. C27(2019)]QEY58048.1 5-oxoprolinase subunit PxpB [Pseudomonas sp. C27(2019)]